MDIKHGLPEFNDYTKQFQGVMQKLIPCIESDKELKEVVLKVLYSLERTQLRDHDLTDSLLQIL